MGEHGLATRALAVAFRFEVDVRRRPLRCWTSDAGVAGRRISTSGTSIDRRPFTAWSDRQYRTRSRRRCTMRRSAPPTSTRCICLCQQLTLMISSSSRKPSMYVGRASPFRTRWPSSNVSARASELATRIGAINTIRTTDNGWLGDNSDVSGFLQPLAGRLSLEGLRAALLGAGGAARAVAVALASQRARVTVHARQRQRAADVAALVDGSIGGWPPTPGSWDLLVNCTPVGMYPAAEDSPLPPEYLRGRNGLRPCLQPAEDAAAAGRRDGGLSNAWWTGHARGPGAAAVRMVDRRLSAGRRHARGGGPETGRVFQSKG